MELTVCIAGSGQDNTLLTLPIDVYSTRGDLLASGSASPSRAWKFEVSTRGEPAERLHVVARLPGGGSLQESVDTKNDKGDVEFDLRNSSPHEWLQWVTAFHSLKHLFVTNDKDPGRRIGKVWMTLWSLTDGRWQSKQVPVASRDADLGMQQVTIAVPDAPHLLQVGGDKVGWRLVALPPGQTVRVALTRTAGSGGDSIDITIARAKADNETILSYLASGAISEANTLAQTLGVADKLLREKIEDPISAAAAGYFLLRNNKLTKREDWVQNLMNWFPAIADGAIIAAALAARTDGKTQKAIRKTIDIALERGLPLFAIGADLLLQTMAAVHRGDGETKRFHASYLALQAYVQASFPVGPYFAFEGLSPAEPTWVSVFGPQDRPGFGFGPDGSPREKLVFSRPKSVRGRYGETNVQLPQAPVSASAAVAMQIAISSQPPALPAPDVPLVEIRPVKIGRATTRLPLSETTFLSHLSTEPLIPILRFGPGNDQPQVREKRASSAPRSEPVQVVKDGLTPARQSGRYWRQQRETNAMTLFDE